MSQRKPKTQMRSLRPTAESLETRQLLSSSSIDYSHPTAVAEGTDPDGTQWVLRLYGPGALSVVGVNGTIFNSSTQDTTDSIDTITVGGSITTQTRLVGTVKGTTGLSKVYFQNLNVTPSGELGKIDLGQVDNFRSVQNGIYAVDMPDFYLAHTETTKPTLHTSIHSNTLTFSAGQIYIPQGVITLRFGGVNVDYTPPGGTALNLSQQSNEFQIALGLPIVQGTSIIVNTVNSDAEANTTTATGPFQDYATFLVAGRLNLFQANQITGNTTAGLVPTQFPNASDPSPSPTFPGGTYVFADGTPTGVTGQIGNLRIGGAATNFTTLVSEDPAAAEAAEGQLDAKISNFSIGGQTDNVLLMAPSGSRNISFGLGMDNVTINSDAISSLRANRDASNSTVTVSRSISNLLIGGDVTNTNINVGAGQSLFTFTNVPQPINSAATGVANNGTGVFWGDLPPTVANPQTNPLTQQMEPFAQNGGTLNARIAGSVNGSVISASVDPDPSGAIGVPTFGAGQGDLQLPRGVINAKVEGTISNANNSLVSDAGKAFFARTVHLTRGPVIPPNVPYAPYPAPTVYHKGQDALKGLFRIDHVPRIITSKTK